SMGRRADSARSRKTCPDRLRCPRVHRALTAVPRSVPAGFSEVFALREGSIQPSGNRSARIRTPMPELWKGACLMTVRPCAIVAVALPIAVFSSPSFAGDFRFANEFVSYDAGLGAA